MSKGIIFNRHSKRIVISCRTYENYQFAIDHLEGESLKMRIFRKVFRIRGVYFLLQLFAKDVGNIEVTDALVIESDTSIVSMSANRAMDDYSVRKKYLSLDHARNEKSGLEFISQLLDMDIAFLHSGVIHIKYFQKFNVGNIEDAKFFMDFWLRRVIQPSLETVDEIKLCVTHGDLAVWNLFHFRDQVFPLDWEFFNPHGLCGLDIFRFWTSYYQSNGNLELCKKEVEYAYNLLGISDLQRREIEAIEMNARESKAHLYKFLR